MSIRLLALSGSLRAVSGNTALLEAARLVAPSLPGDMTVSLFAGLGGLPHFNPDLDGEGSVPPPAVAELRRQIRGADGLLLSAPEYAHGLPGTFKNALDWLVSGGEMAGKPVALLNASPGAAWARASLEETLRVMSARLVPEAFAALPLQGRGLQAGGIASDPSLAHALKASLSAFALAIRGGMGRDGAGTGPWVTLQ